MLTRWLALELLYSRRHRPEIERATGCSGGRSILVELSLERIFDS